MIDFLTWFIMIGAAMGIGFYLGWSNRRYHERREHHEHVHLNPFDQPHVHVTEITPEQAHHMLNTYLQSQARHPSNYRRHPEMEEEDDC